MSEADTSSPKGPRKGSLSPTDGQRLADQACREIDRIRRGDGPAEAERAVVDTAYQMIGFLFSNVSHEAAVRALLHIHTKPTTRYSFVGRTCAIRLALNSKGSGSG
jgi:hypothetical protein